VERQGHACALRVTQGILVIIVTLQACAQLLLTQQKTVLMVLFTV
jgi:hypothetical protein